MSDLIDLNKAMAALDPFHGQSFRPRQVEKSREHQARGFFSSERTKGTEFAEKLLANRPAKPPGRP